MKVLITGGTGFIGSALVRRLVNKGEKVGLVVRKESDIWRIKDLEKNIDFFKGDLTEKRSLEKIFSEYLPDFVYHFATYGNFIGSQKNEDKIFSTNVKGTKNLVEAARNTPVINFGSSSEYGLKNKPMKETDSCNPGNLYGKAKLEQTLYCKDHEIPTLRIFSAYGPREENKRLIPTLILSKLNGGKVSLRESVRDYIYVEDIVESVLNSTEKFPEIKGEIINIGSGIQNHTSDLLKYLDKINPGKLNINWNFQEVQKEPEVWVSDISKAEKLIKWKPQTSLGEGLKKSYIWWENEKNK